MSAEDSVKARDSAQAQAQHAADAAPSLVTQQAAEPAEPSLVIEGLRKQFTKRSLADRLAKREGVSTVALDDVSLSIAPREALALVGESGSGKTTLARSLVRLVEPDAGRVEFQGQDVLSASRKELSLIRRRIQLVYQDPYSSLNGALRIGETIIEPALVHELVDKASAPARLRELMEQVGLNAGLAERRPRALSGGQRQRVAIARALAVQPEVLIADEAVSALDVSVQAQVIRLFATLRQELGLTLIFVSHQLATVAQLCERVAIMYRGQLVELGPTAEVFARPRHGYTAALIGAHPGKRRLRDRIGSNGTTPPPAPLLDRPGCPFQHRCAFVSDVCTTETPPAIWVTPRQMARCHVLPRHPELVASHYRVGEDGLR